MRLLYTLIFYCALPLVMLRLLWRGLKAPEYWRRWSERFGFFQYEYSPGAIWLHAVSLGEVLAAKPLIERILEESDRNLVVTTTTPTGSRQVKKSFGKRVFHVYIPYDLPDCIGRFLKRIQPASCIIMDTEVWPNAIASLHQKSIPISLVNARLSEKSFCRYQKFTSLSFSTFQKIHQVLAQAEADAERFRQLGAKKVTACGSIKLDVSINESTQKQAKAWREYFQKSSDRSLLLAASTHRSEDEIILQAYRQLKKNYSDVLLLIAPRHPERFDEVARLCQRQGFHLQKRSTLMSENKADIENTEVVLLDSLGELLTFYGCTDLVIMGGTFIEHGGHNFIEPAAWGVPVVSGDSVYNFQTIANELVRVGGLTQVQDTKALVEVLLELLNKDDLRLVKGQAAKQYVNDNRGALDKTWQHLNLN